MTLTLIALAAVRAAVLLALVLTALRFMGRFSAATRRSLLVGAFTIVLVLPIASAVLPALHLRGADTQVDPTPSVAKTAPDPIDEAVPMVDVPSVDARAEQTPHAAVARETATSWSPLSIALGVWALGAVIVLARLGIGLARARRLVTSARFVETLDIGGRPVQVRVSSTIETPAVTGLLVPVVLLPEEAATWSAERRRLVLAHELAHVTSRDCLANVIAQLAVAVHWFDPLVWIAARRLRIERELAADDRVLDDGVLPSSYAEHLLALATNHGRSMPQGALAMAEPAEVSLRVRALLAPHTRTPLGRNRFALAGAGLALAAVVACATPEREAAPAPTANEPAATAKPTTPVATASTTI
ncbi:MAG TPA: M56 family metallopeptidase, partial [Kofleriaceae bacterium]|nr:M56 family metallopeptidase [Kofleriaceae bacterium]